METISNLAGTASKAIWGEGNTTTANASGQEPVSGQTGAGTVNEPYDKGNADETTPSGNANTTSSSSSNPVSSTSNIGGPDHNVAPGGGTTTAADSTSKTGTSEAQPSDSVGDPSSGQKPVEKHQGADAPGKVPTGDDGKPRMPRSDSEREALVNSGQEFPRDPNDHSGEPMKVHGAPEQSDKKDDNGEDVRQEGKTDRSKSVSQEGGNPHGKTLGTGEKVVRASGFPAEGGDFDAANPGAGAEATRLQEEKGIHKEKPNQAATTTTADDASGASGDKAKVSKMDKLKQKLHIGSGKNLDA